MINVFSPRPARLNVRKQDARVVIKSMGATLIAALTTPPLRNINTPPTEVEVPAYSGWILMALVLTTGLVMVVPIVQTSMEVSTVTAERPNW
ncbi:hypothetical protein D3C78_810730 [compost metagenome]